MKMPRVQKYENIRSAAKEDLKSLFEEVEINIDLSKVSKITLIEGVPYYSQEKENSCGFANLRMILNYFGANTREEDLYRYHDNFCKRYEDDYGTYPLELASIASQAIKEMELELYIDGWISMSLNPLMEELMSQAQSMNNIETHDFIEICKSYIPILEKELGATLKPICKENLPPWCSPFKPFWSRLSYEEKLDVANDFVYRINLLDRLVQNENCNLHFDYREWENRLKICKESLENGIPFLMGLYFHWWTVIGYMDIELGDNSTKNWVVPALIMYNSAAKGKSKYEVRIYFRNTTSMGDILIIRPKKYW